MHFMERLFLAILFICSGTCLEALPRDMGVVSPKESIKMYFDVHDMPIDEEAFHIRVGGNEWLLSRSIHRDTLGFYTFETDIQCAPHSTAYEKHWQCPYCHLFFPWGSPCTNPNCPSKFRG